MTTEEWLRKIFEIIIKSDADEKMKLLLKFAKIARDVGYEICFDDEE